MKTITIVSPADIGKLIVDALNLDSIKDIKPILEVQTVGHQMNEHEETVFKGYKVEH
jgi:hypothetical protein